MAIRQIVKVGDEVLRENAKHVENFDKKLADLLDDMLQTMNEADGVGLAAPQVGILRQIAIVCVDYETVYELVNPIIKKESGEQFGVEGCLSVPGENGMVKRPEKIVVEWQDRNGKKVKKAISGFEAVAFCHEIDHLKGVLFTDKIIKEDTEEYKNIKKSKIKQ